MSEEIEEVTTIEEDEAPETDSGDSLIILPNNPYEINLN